MRRTFLFSVLTILVSIVIVGPAAFAQQSGATPPMPASSSAPSTASNSPAPPAAKSATTPASGPAASVVAAAVTAATKAAAPPPTPQAEALQFYRTGKFDEAVGAYTKLAPTDPGTAYAGLTRVYLRQRKVEDAYAAANKAITLAPDSPDVHVALAEVYYRQGKIIDADHELVKVVNSGGHSARAYLDLARVSETASYYARAKKMIEMAYRLDPDDPDVHREWLETLPREQRVQELKKYLDGETDDDAKDHSDLMKLLSVLQEEAGQTHRGCHQVNQVHSTQTKLEPLMSDAHNIHGYGLSVNLNGANAKLLLDTGAGGIVIDRKVAERAGIKALVQTEIGGIGSKSGSGGYLGFADTIKIGELEFHDCMVQVVDKRSVLDDDGLIGADVFQHYLVDINLPDAKFGLSELPVDPKNASESSASLESSAAGKSTWHDPYVSPEMKDYSGVYRVGHLLLIPTSLNGKPPKNFLIDTGAFDNTIDTGAAREVTKVHGDDYDEVKGLSGKVKNLYTADKVKIRFSRFEQDRNDLIAFDLTNLSNNAETEVSGTLGFAMLKMLDIKIDYRDGMVNFTYDRNRIH
jgi:tetratricopeptide (TPR) repeat protein/predicted aspartyl protease